MARFTVDASRLNFNVERRGKEYNQRVLQRAQAIFSTLLLLLPSNYTATIQGPNYTIELKAVAVELAKIELALEDVSLDLDYTRTRSEFLYGIIGYLCFLNNRLPSLEFSDGEFRQFLLSLIRIYFQGSIPKSIKDAVGLFLTSDFQILENFLLVREGTAGLDISDQFGFQIDVATGNQFPSEIFELQSSIRIILDIVRPAHTLFSVRFIFSDEYEPNEDTFGRILDSMRWKLSSYYYEDYRKYWAGLRDRDRLGARQCHTVTGEVHSVVNSIAEGVIQTAFAASGTLVPINNVVGTFTPGFEASGVLTLPASLASGVFSQSFEATGSSLIIDASSSLSTSFAASGELVPFEPSQLTQLTAWLRVSNATSGVNGISSLPDFLNTNPAVQTVDARKPALGTSVNGLPIMTFATNDVLSWPLNASNNSNTKVGFAFWMRQPVSALETLFCIYNGTGGASVRKFFIQTNTARRLVFRAYTTVGGDGRQGTTTTNVLPVAGTWVWVRTMYDSTGATEADKVRMYINGSLQALTFADIGAGGTLGTLLTATGNALIGNLNDGVVGSIPLNGDLGPNFYVLNNELTTQEETNLMSYQQPT